MLSSKSRSGGFFSSSHLDFLFILSLLVREPLLTTRVVFQLQEVDWWLRNNATEQSSCEATDIGCTLCTSNHVGDIWKCSISENRCVSFSWIEVKKLLEVHGLLSKSHQVYRPFIYRQWDRIYGKEGKDMFQVSSMFTWRRQRIYPTRWWVWTYGI